MMRFIIALTNRSFLQYFDFIIQMSAMTTLRLAKITQYYLTFWTYDALFFQNLINWVNHASIKANLFFGCKVTKFRCAGELCLDTTRLIRCILWLKSWFPANTTIKILLNHQWIDLNLCIIYSHLILFQLI